MATHTCQLGPYTVGADKLTLLAGPCMAESLDLCRTIAETLVPAAEAAGVQLVFKASFDKANRSSATSYRGPGIEEGLTILEVIKSEFGVPVVTDIHLPEQAAPVAEVCDVLQIPAFLCRQTDLLVAAGETGKTINVKKGQFMSPAEMQNVAEKVRSTGNQNVMLTDRGTFFGYNRLVTDFRCMPQMKQFAPVCYDATHSVQEPGGLGAASGGERQYAPMLAKSALVCGADALFIETHTDPDNALSDAGCQIATADMLTLLPQLAELYQLSRA